LILLINPNEESLGVIMEDTSSLWPVSVKTTSVKESVALFEKEMIIDQLLLVFFGHALERVVFTTQLSSELRENARDLCLNFVSLFFGDTWSKWILCQVSSNSDSCRKDHTSLSFGEWWAVELLVVHVADMLVTNSMLMVVLNNGIKKLWEGVV